MFDINMLLSTPFGCDEAVIYIVNDVPFPKRHNWGLGLRYIFSSHATTYIACVQVDLLEMIATSWPKIYSHLSAWFAADIGISSDVCASSFALWCHFSVHAGVHTFQA